MLHAIAGLCAAAALAAGNDSFDHSAFDRLLKAHVVDGMVDYDAFARAPGFPRYLDQLARARPDTLSAKEQLAYWINVYNAYTIRLVNAHDERKSIRNIDKTLGVIKAMGPWKEEIVEAGGKTMSLDFVEHEIVRKRFQEPRIHFALVCAAEAVRRSGGRRTRAHGSTPSSTTRRGSSSRSRRRKTAWMSRPRPST